MPWGVEHLTEKERQRLIVEAGVDQIGGDDNPRYIIEMVKEGAVPERRIDDSARRVLKPLFQLGLFENPYVDPDRPVYCGQQPFHAETGKSPEKIDCAFEERGLLPLPETQSCMSKT